MIAEAGYISMLARSGYIQCMDGLKIKHGVGAGGYIIYLLAKK